VEGALSNRRWERGEGIAFHWGKEDQFRRPVSLRNKTKTIGKSLVIKRKKSRGKGRKRGEQHPNMKGIKKGEVTAKVHRMGGGHSAL